LNKQSDCESKAGVAAVTDVPAALPTPLAASNQENDSARKYLESSDECRLTVDFMGHLFDVLLENNYLLPQTLFALTKVNEQSIDANHQCPAVPTIVVDCPAGSQKSRSRFRSSPGKCAPTPVRNALDYVLEMPWNGCPLSRGTGA
jgi:hypothetical protein